MNRRTITTAAIVILSAIQLIVPCIAAEKKESESFKNVDVTQFEKLRSDHHNVVLDVRTKKEYDAGHIPGAINLDWYDAGFAEKVSKLDKGKTYLVHCASGGRSAKACGKMGQLDFPKLYNLEGGFKAWEKAGNKPAK